MQHHTVAGLVEAVHRTDRHAGCVGAVHAGHRDGTLAGLAVVDGDDAAPVHAPGNLMLVLAGRDAGVALDAALGVRSEEHTSELQSLMRISYAVFCLKKKTNTSTITASYTRNSQTSLQYPTTYTTSQTK